MWYLARLGLASILLVSTSPAVQAENPALPLVMANDNRTASGQLKNGVLKLELELNQGRWYPEDEAGQYREVFAFAEKGHAPQSSGPLIRVPQGTKLRVTVHNALPFAAKVYGLHSRPGDAKDALLLAPDETRELQFLAGEPGTYSYWSTTSDKSLEGRRGAETLLSGAFIVDPRGAIASDRIFVLGVWLKITESSAELIPFINGKSWPYTEHLTYHLGETVHWRVIDTSDDPHGMHLHGFFFKVDGVGDGEHYLRYPEEQRRQQVTELIDPGHTFEMSWVPERSGNWLFHCHMMMHMSVPEALHPKEASNKEGQSVDYPPQHDRSAGMGGLVIGITVLPGIVSAPQIVTKAAHKLQLVISDNPDKVPLYKLEVNDPQAQTQSDKNLGSLLGPPIVLTRGEETEIEVKNATSSPTAIHWHGIELESFYDGVAGWTGSGQQTTPAIAPGQSFNARMAPPRAGTFIYHTHWHDQKQLENGVYGPLIVLEPGQKYDPEHDKTFVFAIGRYAPFGAMLIVNGSPEPAPMELHSGTRYRLRLINITTNESDLRVQLESKNAPVRWNVIAKDGADLPLVQRASSMADMAMTVGSTCDVEYESDREEHVEMRISAAGFEALIMQPLDVVSPK